ncbi:MAG: tetratricopeptide repeat protein [Acidobacteria bacterium]|nr:MAG: tetratricopeptide repeat protein [Acidobacteriota bacterium]
MRLSPPFVSTVLIMVVSTASLPSVLAQTTDPRRAADGQILTGNIALPSELSDFPGPIHVTLLGSQYRETTTAAVGTFAFRSVPPGDYVIEVRARGYETTRIEIRGWSWGMDVTVPLGRPADASSQVPQGSPTVTVRSLKIPEKALKLAEKAQQESDRQQLEKAVEHLKKAVDICPDFVEAWNNMGVTYLRMKKFSEAEAAFLKAIESDAKSVAALRNLGFLFLQTERPREALGVLERARDAGKQEDAYTDTYLGHALYQTGRYGEAEPVLKRALSLKPDFPAALYPLALAQLKLQKYQDARQNFARFLEMYDTGAEAEVARTALARLEQLLPQEGEKQAE